ncbi:MAG TPA: retropepsin-like aspartic protease [Anaerolineae bacterium]
MPTYDTRWFDPPAPLARVVLRNPATGAARPDVPMLLDSGADVSLVPQAVADQLGVAAIPDRRYELIGFDGSTSFAPVVRLELVFYRRTFRGQFLLVDQEWGILGRNVLNEVQLLLDGPNLTWDEHRRESAR